MTFFMHSYPTSYPTFVDCERSEQLTVTSVTPSKGEGSGQTNTKCYRKMQPVLTVIVVYFFHLPDFPSISMILKGYKIEMDFLAHI